jgi:mandelate racemase
MAPLDQPISTATISIPKAPLVLIDIETDAGITGTSYIFGYTPLVLAPLVRLIENLSDTLIGRTADTLDRFSDMEQTFLLLGRQGLVCMAIAAIDMALWDARAKAREETVAASLGAAPVPIRCYDSLGVFRAGRDDAMIETTLAKGFTALKVKLAGGSARADVADLKALRQITGPDVEVMIDYNQSLDTPDAIRRIRTFEDASIDLTWVEDPVPAEDLTGHQAIRAAVSTAIQTGENWWLPDDAARALQARISDYAMLDIVKIGGVTGWMRAAALAKAASVPVSSHLFPEASAHVLSATPGRHYLEYLDVAGALLQAPPTVENGYLTAKGPGLGLHWNEAAVKAHMI